MGKYWIPQVRRTPKQEASLRRFATAMNMTISEAVRYCESQVIDDYPDNMASPGEYDRVDAGLTKKLDTQENE